MASKRTALEVGSRFRDEQGYIERYVRMQRAKPTVHDRQVHDLNRILTWVHVPLLHYDRIGDPALHNAFSVRAPVRHTAFSNRRI